MARRVTHIKESDPLPESDRVDGFAHPRETEELFGHGDAARMLEEGHRSGKLHHGWLLSGPQGIGKSTLAYGFAKYILARPEERDSQNGVLGLRLKSPTASLVRAQSHPGLLVIRRPYDFKSKRFVASIPIDEVRRVRNFLTHSGGDGSWRVVIIDTADEMNINAANAVLKSLEEPPERAVFLLITSEPGQLLATIRSRCRSLKMSPLSSSDLDLAARSAFARSGVDLPGEPDWSRLLELGDGRVGRVLGLSGMGGVGVFSEVEKILTQIKKPDWPAIHALGDKLAPIASMQKFDLFFELLLEQLSRLIRARFDSDGSGPMNVLAQQLIAETSLPEWASLWEEISRSKIEISALNLDRKAFFIQTLENIHALARRTV